MYQANTLGIGRSRRVVTKLASLFALDSFAGGFVVQSFAAYWFYLRFGSLATAIGALFGGTLTHALQKTVMTPVVS